MIQNILFKEILHIKRKNYYTKRVVIIQDNTLKYFKLNEPDTPRLIINIPDYNIKIYNYDNEKDIGKIIFYEENIKKPILAIKVESSKTLNDLAGILTAINKNKINISDDLELSTNKLTTINNKITNPKDTDNILDLIDKSIDIENENINEKFKEIKNSKKIMFVKNNIMYYYINKKNPVINYLYEYFSELIFIIKHLFYFSKFLITVLIIILVLFVLLPIKIKAIVLNVFIFLIVIITLILFYINNYYKGFLSLKIFNIYKLNSYLSKNLIEKNNQLFIYFEYLICSNYRKNITPNIKSLVKNENEYEIISFKNSKSIFTQEIKQYKNNLIILEYNNKQLIRFFYIKNKGNNFILKIYSKDYEELALYNKLININIINLIKSNKLTKILTKDNFTSKFVTDNKINNTNILNTTNNFTANESYILRKTALNNLKITQSETHVDDIITKMDQKISEFHDIVDKSNWVKLNNSNKNINNNDNYKLFEVKDDRYLFNKIEMEFDCPFDNLANTINNYEIEHLFNSDIETINLIQKYNDNLSLQQLITKKQFIVKSREFLYYNYKKVYDDGVLFINCVAENHLVKENKNYVRGEVYLAARKIEKLDNGRLRVKIVNKIDPKVSMIPKSILDKANKKNHDYIIEVKKYLTNNK